MNSGSDQRDDDTPLGTTEARALRRLVEPVSQVDQPAHDELWALRYRIQQPLGHGGMGDVFLAHDALLDRLVALKILRNTRENFVDERQLLREARTAARAEHERVARVYDVGTWNDHAFIAMEYVRGETLRAWLKTRQLDPREIVEIVRQLIEGVRALHERGLVHRDLKPENVMVTPDGMLRILDLGIARRVALSDTVNALGDDCGNTSIGVGVGTPGYMAPEQWRQAETDARVDLFAVGVIAYELVVGQAPFCGGTKLEVREKTLRGVVDFDGPVWEAIPEALKTVIRGALRGNPNERFATVADMAQELTAALDPPLPSLSANQAAARPSGDGRAAPESLGGSALAPPNRPTASRPSVWLIATAALTAIGIALAPRLREPSMPPPDHGMVQFRAATFTMGSEPAEIEVACRTYTNTCPREMQNETPSRMVNVAPFELDEREVTNEEFAKFLTTIGASLRVVDDDEHHYPRLVHYALRPGDEFLLYDLWERSTGLALSGASHFEAKPGFERLPVTLVTWLGARLYCQSVGKRLPTETEWEYAARGVEKRPFPWGSDLPSCGGVHIPSDGTLRVLNSERCENSRTIPFPVMTAPQDRTPQGVYDLGGNVVEWVDENGVDDEQAYANRLRAESPAVMRGGAYDTSFYTRTTSRSFRLAFNAGYNIGFRCAKSIHITQ